MFHNRSLLIHNHLIIKRSNLPQKHFHASCRHGQLEGDRNEERERARFFMHSLFSLVRAFGCCGERYGSL